MNTTNSYLLGAILSMAIAASTIFGLVQGAVKFGGSGNEIVFSYLMIILSIALFLSRNNKKIVIQEEIA